MKSSTNKDKVLVNFQICISVSLRTPLVDASEQIEYLYDTIFREWETIKAETLGLLDLGCLNHNSEM